jgi:hypothetical protein
VRRDGRIEILETGEQGVPGTEFMMLHEARIRFRGTAPELLASDDPYLREFLYRTLPPW